MSFQYIRTIPSPDHLKALMPLSSKDEAVRTEKINELKAVFSGEDSRLLLIIGPCRFCLCRVSIRTNRVRQGTDTKA